MGKVQDETHAFPWGEEKGNEKPTFYQKCRILNEDETQNKVEKTERNRDEGLMQNFVLSTNFVG